MPRPLEIFARRLRGLRKERHLRQEEVAVRLNVSRQTISKYERGEREPDFHMLRKLADYYQVSIDFLFGRTPIRQVNIPPDPSAAPSGTLKVAEQGDWDRQAEVP